ncbi:MAG: tRNA 4-thiouridine(8) synthase ThiI [Deltaproteobacteria bacterium]|nr:tRNA 4-thiouridine(8) synthase ThiI [Deltaproteobacteria bacterium]
MACVVVRYHEIALKGGNRQRFVQRLIANLRAATTGLGVRSADGLPGRIVLRLAPEAPVGAVCERVARTFGVANYSVGVEVPVDLDVIRAAVLDCARAEPFTTFAVRARRADKSFPMTSPELGALLGAAVVAEVGGRVDLDAPDLPITVEILPRTAYVSGGKRPGPGGLPVTISGRVTCLMSGGIDSPVAAYRMMQRGCRVDFVHFSGAPYTSRASIDKAHDLVEHLTRWQLRSDLWVVPFGEIQSEIVARVPRSHRVVLYRRMMLRIAEALGRHGARVLVTGESLGQVSSQTLENMQTIAAATSALVLRPLVGMDKNEIIQQATRIGTFATSILPDQDCCTLFTPAHPTTRATLAEVEAAERQLDVPALVARGVAEATRARFVFPPELAGAAAAAGARLTVQG